MTELRESHGRELLAYAHALSLRDIPADVIDRAKTCLLDAMGCGLFGSTQPWSQILAAEMVDEGSSGHSSVIGCQTLLSAPVAALCNGTAIHGFELDDLIAASIIHPAASVIPAALATAESTDAGGGRLMEAIVAGYEVMHRLSLALGTEAAKRGFHTTESRGASGLRSRCRKTPAALARPDVFRRRTCLFGRSRSQEFCGRTWRRNGQAAASWTRRRSRGPHGATGGPRFPRAAICHR